MRSLRAPSALANFCLIGLALTIQPLHALADESRHVLSGVVVDVEGGAPIPHVTVTVDERRSQRTRADGAFEFADVPAGSRTVRFQHVSYEPYVIVVDPADAATAPGRQDPSRLVIELQPSAFTVAEVVVVDEAIDPSFPVSVTAIDRQTVELTAGNVANDALRSLQAQPSATWSGIDFNSRTAIRGGDPEEQRVYLDGFPLAHYAHVGGFAEVVLGEFVEQVVLIPGAAPLRYGGNLSGVIAYKPAYVDSTENIFRYDITSIAAGTSRRLRDDVHLQASIKSSFFNLPAHQQINVDDKTFRDVYVRLGKTFEGGQTLTATVLAATDSERSEPERDVELFRKTRSLLVGANWTLPIDRWTVRLRPYVTTYNSQDDVTSIGDSRDHRVRTGSVAGEVERLLGPLSLVLSGHAGVAEHRGRGDTVTDYPLAIAGEGRLRLGRDRTLVLGVGGNREPWTQAVEPEAYGSLQLGFFERANFAVGFRRSHQTPFLFTETRHFASIPIDPGDLRSGYVGGAPAVRMDQLSASAAFASPGGVSLHTDGYRRRYERLLTWQWNDAFIPVQVTSAGDGIGHGYEVRLARESARGLTAELAYSQARVEKWEGSLAARRAGDFDLPDGWRARLAYPLTENLHLSLAWQQLAGRPYTLLDNQATPLPDALVNADRFDRYRRLDLKLHYRVMKETSEILVFLDLINVLNQTNYSTLYAFESSPGRMTSYAYGGARFFPIVGASVRTW